MVHNTSGDSDITLILNISYVHKTTLIKFPYTCDVSLHEPVFVSRQKSSKVPEVTSRVGRLAKRKAMLCLVEKSSNESSSSSSSFETSQKSKTSRSVNKCAASSLFTVFLQQMHPVSTVWDMKYILGYYIHECVFHLIPMLSLSYWCGAIIRQDCPPKRKAKASKSKISSDDDVMRCLSLQTTQPGNDSRSVHPIVHSCTFILYIHEKTRHHVKKLSFWQ